MWDIIIAYGIDVIIILIPIILEFFDKKLKIVKNVEEFLSVLDDFYKLQGLDFSQFLLFIFKMLKNKKYRKYLNLKKF